MGIKVRKMALILLSGSILLSGTACNLMRRKRVNTDKFVEKAYQETHVTGCPTCGRIKSAISRQKRVMCLETGVIYDSATQAIKETGYSKISSCVVGIRKTAGGFHWKYVDN